MNALCLTQCLAECYPCEAVSEEGGNLPLKLRDVCASLGPSTLSRHFLSLSLFPISKMEIVLQPLEHMLNENG